MTTTAFALHALGSDASEFDPVASELVGTLDVQGIDLPGFGSSAPEAPGIEDMVLHVESHIGRSGATDWALIGHSMGGKIASVVASRTLSGANGLFGLRAVVLVAASPLSPEPMDEDRRRQMLGWVSDGAISEDDAETFVDANTAEPLPEALRRAAVASVRKSAPDAWRAWLTRGSLEDWSHEFAPNPAPALILAGASDGDLGPDAQRELNVPHWTASEFVEVPGVAHLIPLERPGFLAAAIRDFWSRRVAGAPVVGPETARVIASPRVSARTRGILATRALSDPPLGTALGAALDAARVLTATQLATLGAVARVTVPQLDGVAMDLAVRVDTQLASGVGDGWRVAGSPPDAEAYRRALDALEPHAAQGDAAVAEALDAVRSGSFEPPQGGLTAAQMRVWEEDAAVDLVKQWLAHPATMAGVGYDGFANGGDGVRKQGFSLLGAGQYEAWEPREERR